MERLNDEAFRLHFDSISTPLNATRSMQRAQCTAFNAPHEINVLSYTLV